MNAHVPCFLFYMKTNFEMSLPDMSPVSPEKKENLIYWQNQQIICKFFVTVWASVVSAVDRGFLLSKYLSNSQKIM